MDYTVILVSLTYFRRYYESRFPDLQKRYTLKGKTPVNLSDKEALYDWTVRHAFSIVLSSRNNSAVHDHYRHDLYKCIYDYLKQDIESEVINVLSKHSLMFLKNECVKILVAGDNIFIARGITNVKEPF